MSEKVSINSFFHKWWKWLTPSVLLAMLIISTLILQAFNSASASASPALATSSTSTCQITYVTAAQPQGFGGDLTITNTTSRTLHHWKVEILFDNRPLIVASWNGILSQVGNKVIIKNTPSNGVVKPGATINPNPGFFTSWNNNSPVPVSIKFNGESCKLTIIS